MRGKRYSEIAGGKRALLCRIFNCNAVMIWAALTYQTYSVQAEVIHCMTLRNGGVIMRINRVSEEFIPN